ncbi:Imm26 family immunity protein [Pseudomonas sp. NPDC089758]|uniref:Imm26 family immunity protein n=1 Tax=Pseudomonas sp. NPDC089758 TaxID=3364473 RepID=UPI0038095D16
MQSGDYFLIPMEDGRFAVSQVIWMGIESKEQKFKKIFALGVLSIGREKTVPESTQYLSFKDHKESFAVIFTAVDNLKSGEWPILRPGSLCDSSWESFEFNMAGILYRRGEPVRLLSIDEYQNHLLMGVSGYALVERFLQQY